MEEQRITLETSLLLRDVFPEMLGKRCYVKGLDNILPWTIRLTCNDIIVGYAPEQSLLQKYLREKYNCHIQITHEPYTNGINFNVQVLFYNPNSVDCWDELSSGVYGDNGEFPTYEEALEFGLQEALRRIKESKSSK